MHRSPRSLSPPDTAAPTRWRARFAMPDWPLRAPYRSSFVDPARPSEISDQASRATKSGIFRLRSVARRAHLCAPEELTMGKPLVALAAFALVFTAACSSMDPQGDASPGE